MTFLFSPGWKLASQIMFLCQQNCFNGAWRTSGAAQNLCCVMLRDCDKKKTSQFSSSPLENRDDRMWRMFLTFLMWRREREHSPASWWHLLAFFLRSLTNTEQKNLLQIARPIALHFVTWHLMMVRWWSVVTPGDTCILWRGRQLSYEELSAMSELIVPTLIPVSR